MTFSVMFIWLSADFGSFVSMNNEVTSNIAALETYSLIQISIKSLIFFKEPQTVSLFFH